MKIQLSDHFSYKRLLRFVAPSILMLLCTSVYSIVDGFFVSNYVGKTPFAALNLVMPVLMGVGTLGFMAGTGGSAVVSMTLGEGKKELANEFFSLIVYVTLALSIVVGFICFADRTGTGSKRRTGSGLRALFQNLVFVLPGICYAVFVPELFYRSGEADFEFKGKCDRRTDQCGVRLCVDRGISFGTGGSSTGYRSGTARRRNHPCNLFFQRERQLTAAGEGEVAWKSHLADCDQRIF